MKKKLISIIVPVYNEEKNLPLFYERLVKAINKLAERYDFEFLFINDASGDKSGEVLDRLMGFDNRLKYLEFSRNFGKEIALSAGLHHAQGEAAITLDADLQHPPELIPVFVKKWEEGAEIVIGVRKKDKSKNLLKKIGSSFFCRIMSLIGETQILPAETDFRLLDRVVVQEFNRFTERGRIARGLIDWLGFKRDCLYFEAEERKFGQPSYGLFKLIRLGFFGFVSHSLFPLKLAGYLGIFITVFSGVLGFFMLVNRWLWKDPFSLKFSNLAMLAVFIMFLVGIVLICLGLIALYIASINAEITNRPLYVIRKKRNL
jgi:dolichol-phosphate mannosyltransferase